MQLKPGHSGGVSPLDAICTANNLFREEAVGTRAGTEGGGGGAGVRGGGGSRCECKQKPAAAAGNYSSLAQSLPGLEPRPGGRRRGWTPLRNAQPPEGPLWKARGRPRVSTRHPLSKHLKRTS